MSEVNGVILETNYTMKLTRGELRTLVKAVQCVELYEGQGPDLQQTELTDSELNFLRRFRAQMNEFSVQNIAGA